MPGRNRNYNGDKTKLLPSGNLHLEEEAETNRYKMTGCKCAMLSQVNPSLQDKPYASTSTEGD